MRFKDGEDGLRRRRAAGWRRFMSFAVLVGSGVYAGVIGPACAPARPPLALAPPLPEREAGPLSPQHLAHASTGMSATVAAAAAPGLEEVGGVLQLTFPVGGEQPIRCFIYPHAVPLAQTLRTFVVNVQARAAEHRITDLDAGEMGGQPYLRVATRYRLAGDPAEGAVKYLASRGARMTTLCLHDEPGYTATFERLVGQLVGSLRLAEDPAAHPQVLAWHGIFVGRSRQHGATVVDSQLLAGATRHAYSTMTSSLEVLADGVLQATDATDTQFSTVDGRVLASLHTQVRDGELQHALRLMAGSTPQQYLLSGQLGARHLDEILLAHEALSDQFEMIARLRQLGHSVGASGGSSAAGTDAASADVAFEVYNPAQPLAITTAHVRPLERRRQSIEAWVEDGQARHRVVFDRRGLLLRSDDLTSQMQRVWQDRSLL